MTRRPMSALEIIAILWLSFTLALVIIVLFFAYEVS